MPHTVVIRSTGHRFSCDGNATVLSAALAAGLFLPYSCRSGVCNTCRGRVLEGEVDLGAVHPAHLSDADRAEGYAMLCQARAKSDLLIDVRELAAIEAIRPKIMPARVLALQRAAPDVMLLTLGLPANEPVLFRGGQYLEVLLPDGSRRNYSMANAPTAEGVRQLELHLRHLPGGRFTDRVFTTLKVRDMLKVEVPMGTFYLREDSDKPIVMVASGTGFAPIKAIVEHSLTQGLRRPIDLYWGGRRRADLYMADVAERWAAEHAHIRFIPVLSHATPECCWQGRIGFVHQAVLDDFVDMSRVQVYACGAPVVVDCCRREFVATRGLPADEFFADSFLTAADKLPAPTT
jgi:CDP-4-dehydro-6-deoxyglucose reductase